MQNALAACAFAIPFSAAAATMSVDITYPAGANFANANSNPFPEFNPALGTLTSYSLTVAGAVTSSDSFTPEIVFKDPGTFDAILDLLASGTNGGGVISGAGSTSSSGDLAAVTGTGTAEFLVQDFSNRNDFDQLHQRHTNLHLHAGDDSSCSGAVNVGDAACGLRVDRAGVDSTPVSQQIGMMQTRQA